LLDKLVFGLGVVHGGFWTALFLQRLVVGSAAGAEIAGFASLSLVLSQTA